MKELRFPYVRYLVTPPEKKPSHYVYRPVIPVRLSLGKKKMITFDALIDSGADECSFPGWIAETLGHNLHKGKGKIFSGIGGSVLSYLHRTSLEVNGIRFITDIYYSHDWDDMPFGLLGEAGFFSQFSVNFNYKEKVILLKILE